MTDLLLASMVLLWVVVLVFGVLLFALARQVGVILERVSPVGALMTNASLRVGNLAPRLQLKTLDGADLEVGGAGTNPETPRSQLLLFVGPKCPVCKALLSAARSIAKRESAWMELVLASDGGTEEAHRKYIAKHKLDAIPCTGSRHMRLAGFGWPVLEKGFHGGHPVQGVVGPYGVVEALVFGQSGAGVFHR